MTDEFGDEFVDGVKQGLTIGHLTAENERLRTALDLLYYEVLAKMTLEAMASLGTLDFELDDYILESSSGLWHGVKTARAALGEGGK